MFVALGDRRLTNETVFDLPDLPRSLAVIGAGPLGLELAQGFARLTVEVAVFDEGEQLAAFRADDVAAELRAILEGELPIHLGVFLSAKREGDAVALSWSGATEGNGTFEYVLVATGRRRTSSFLILPR